MFGTYRTFLAVCVVAQHLLSLPLIGGFAVQGFFILSGYLMTTVMQRSYGYSVSGIGSFALNRALRLLPSYWVILLLSAILVSAIGPVAMNRYHHIGMPDSFPNLLANLFLIYPGINPHDYWPRLAPVTWALTVEIFYYALISLGISRTLWSSVLLFVCGVAFQVIVVVWRLGTDWQYFSLPAGALPFGLGAILYHVRDRLPRISIDGWLLVAAFVPIFLGYTGLTAVFAIKGHPGLAALGYYGNIPLNALMIALLIHKKAPEIDRTIGDFSYHLYVSHVVIAATLAVGMFGMVQPERNYKGAVVMVLTLILCTGFSLVLTQFVDQPVERLRQKIRRGRAATGETPDVAGHASTATAPSGAQA